MKHICKYCGKEFERKHKAQKYCDSCKAKSKAVLQGRIHDPNNPQICHYCGKTFIGRKRKYCNRNCAIKAHNDKPNFYQHKCELCGIEWESKTRIAKRCKKCANKQIHTYICLNCGKEFHPKAKNRDKYCSRECAFEHKKAKPKEKIRQKHLCVCIICGKEFESERKFKYCSDDCRKEKDRIYAYKKAVSNYIPEIKTCLQCGKEFATSYGNNSKTFCGKECGKKYQRKQSKRTRKAKLKKVVKVKYSDMYIFKRDKWVCQLCGEKVNPKHIGNHPLAASIDHIIPISKGGADAPYNVRLAHRDCNRIKSDGLYNNQPEQLMLFG